jgi:hypothetical protein
MNIEVVVDSGELVVAKQVELTSAGQRRLYNWEHMEGRARRPDRSGSRA